MLAWLAPVLVVLRHPLVAVAFGVALPLVVIPKYGLMFASGFGSFFGQGTPESWFALSSNPLHLYQHLFLIASTATLFGWLITRSKHPFIAASLTGYAIVAAVLGALATPLSLLFLMGVEDDAWMSMTAIAAPWLAAASFGACAIESHSTQGRTKVTSSSPAT